MLVIQMRAAINEPVGPRLARATVTHAIATASTASAEGRRAVHSLRTPETAKEAATSQFTKGGLRKYGLLPIRGTMKLPVSSIRTAGKIRLPSSPLMAIEPSAGR